MSDATPSECAILQEEELQVLESIYPDCILPSNDASGTIKKFEVSIELGDCTSVHIVDDGSTHTAAGPSQNVLSHAPPEILSLSAFPPILLEIYLPPDYPESQPPRINSLHVSHDWLTSSASLRQRMLEMFQPGEGVLYNWVEWLRSGDFLRELRLYAHSNGEEIIRLPHPLPRLLAPRLSSYDNAQRSSQFSQHSYECSVCFNSRKGSRCLLLSCGHIFCRECLEDGWKLYIAEGDISHVGCLDPTCVKEGREADEEEVRRVVTEEEVRRWLWLRQKRVFERDPQTVHCPMALCQTPIPKPTDLVDDGSGWERLRTCPACNYSFCSFCKRTWHGSLTDCPIPLSEKVITEYLSSTEGSSARKNLELRYGAKNLVKLIARWQEEKANRDYFEENSTSCPHCTVRVQKSHGCNHMTCAKCKTHFCYRCGQRLQPSNPYAHFSTPNLPCYQQLFDQSELDTHDWQPVELLNIAFEGL
ncbi:RWD-domain-containing protein [Peniophora sp. CONT]|nr:RWD-domain-containing protein [Peniophora sp. CONT]